MKKDTIIIISSYANSPEKETTLRQCVDSLAPLGYGTLHVSHLPIPPELSTSFTYSIYDSVNPILPLEQSPTFWFGTDVDTVHLYKQGNATAVVRNLISGLNLTKGLGYKNFLYFDYDSVIHSTDLSFIESVASELHSNKACFLRDSAFGDFFFESRFFGGQIEWFLGQAKWPIDLVTWGEIEPFKSHTNSLEALLYSLFGASKEIAIREGGMQKLCPSSKIDIFSICPEITPIFNEINPLLPLLFFVNNSDREQEYTIYDDNKQDFTDIVIAPNSNGKYFVDLTENECCCLDILNCESFYFGRNSLELLKKNGKLIALTPR